MRHEIHDGFAMREGERYRLFDMSEAAEMAVMLADIPALPGPSNPDALSCCCVAAHRVGGVWNWLFLAPSTKMVVTEMLMETDRRNEWVELRMTATANVNPSPDGAWRNARGVLAPKEASDGN